MKPTVSNSLPVSTAEHQSRWTTLLLGLMMILAPAMGVPSEELLQDTLKSGVVSLLTLGTALLFFWPQRGRQTPWVWHGLLWLPIGLAVYALGSMTWSHAYLGGVEAVRWSVFALMMWLGLNTRAEDLEGRLLWGIHWGVTIASLWAAAQFWGNFDLFPQGPNPASTFVNRNFFAEFAICALPYSLLLMLRVGDFRESLCLAAGIGFNVVALMMTGTRSALMALIVLCLVWPFLMFRCWSHLSVAAWDNKKKLSVALAIVGTVLLLGSLPTGNPKLTAEFGASNALARAGQRAASVAKADEYSSGSFSIRSVMWLATVRMAQDNPLTGVGAGAWEVEIPRYQATDSVTETDYYAHNEFLQLVAEYGLTGALFIGLLFAYLIRSAWSTWTDRSSGNQEFAPLRAAALVSLLMLLIVSNAGFPWRMACTGALFALGLAILANTDAYRIAQPPWLLSRHIFTPAKQKLTLAVASICTVFALFACLQAARAERSLIRGTQLAMLIGATPDPRNPRWAPAKAQMLEQVREGIAINPHYRKITPLVADQLASWGDWQNALWIWESVDASRPNVIAIICNISRAHMELGDLTKARSDYERALHLYPNAPAVAALDIELLAKEGHFKLAKQKLLTFFHGHTVDGDLALLAYKLGIRNEDGDLVVQALEWRLENQPRSKVETLLKLGSAFDRIPDIQDSGKALSYYRAAWIATPDKYKDITRGRVPDTYRARLSNP